MGQVEGLLGRELENEEDIQVEGNVHETKERSREEMIPKLGVDVRQGAQAAAEDNRQQQRDAHHVHSRPHHSTQSSPLGARPGMFGTGGSQDEIVDGLVEQDAAPQSPGNGPQCRCGK